MAQYQSGVVKVTNGVATVDAQWKASLSGALDAYFAGGRLEFTESSAIGRVISHNLAGSSMVFDLESGSPDPQDGTGGATPDQVNGPTLVNQSGTTVTGFTTTTLDDAAKAGIWIDDEHNGRWVRLRPGDPQEEWRRISDTIGVTGTLVVSPAWTVDPVVTDPYQIYENQLTTLAGFPQGTPQDFIAAGVVNGDPFSVLGDDAWYTIGSRTARQLTLTGNFAGTTQEGASFIIHKDFTTRRSLPLFARGDTGSASLLNRAMMLLDAASESWRTVGDPGEPAFENSWTAPASQFPQFYKDHLDVVRLQGRIKKSSPGSPEVVFTLPVGYRPSRVLLFTTLDAGFALSIVSVSTDGSVVYWTGTSTVAMYLDGIQFRAV